MVADPNRRTSSTSARVKPTTDPVVDPLTRVSTTPSMSRYILRNGRSAGFGFAYAAIFIVALVLLVSLLGAFYGSDTAVEPPGTVLVPPTSDAASAAAPDA